MKNSSSMVRVRTCPAQADVKREKVGVERDDSQMGKALNTSIYAGYLLTALSSTRSVGETIALLIVMKRSDDAD